MDSSSVSIWLLRPSDSRWGIVFSRLRS